MLSLTKYENNDGLEFQIDTATGLAYASVRATERMLDVAPGTISMFLKTQAAKDLVLFDAEVQTPGGLQGAKLLSSEQVFNLAFKYNLDLAQKMGAAGANIYMLGIAGYKVQVIEQPKELSRKDLALMVIAESDRADALAAQIEADSEATDIGKVFEHNTKGNIRIGEFAKILGVGQNKYFDELREDRIIMQTGRLPYQEHMNAKRFTVTEVLSNGKWYPVALITPKGQTYLAKRHAKFVERQAATERVELLLPAMV